MFTSPPPPYICPHASHTCPPISYSYPNISPLQPISHTCILYSFMAYNISYVSAIYSHTSPICILMLSLKC